MAKKNKRTREETEPQLNANNGHSDDSHNTKKLKKKEKNKNKNKNKNKDKTENENDQDEEAKHIPTVSIAVPASIIDNVPTLELATRVPLTPNQPKKKRELASVQEVLNILPNFFFFFNFIL